MGLPIEQLDDLLAQAMQVNKPHLLLTEQELQQVDYGAVIVRFDRRAGKTVKMVVTTEKTYLMDK